MDKKTVFINFPVNGGVRQFSTSLVKYMKGSVEFIDLSGSWRNRVRLIKYRNENIVFGNNNLWIYLFIYFMRGKLSIVLHDHKVRVGASGRERLNLWLFNFFINKFELVIIHSARDDEAKKLLNRSNVVYKFMPPHGFPSEYVERDTCDNKFFNHILCFGRIEDYKNFDYLAEALSGCPDTKLTIAGSGQVSQTLAFIVNNNNNIELINKFISDEELISLVNSHKYIALPYKDITQTGLIELAGYFGKPIITSDIPQFLNDSLKEFRISVPIDDLHSCRLILKDLECLKYSKYISMCNHSRVNFNKKMGLWFDYVDALGV